MIHGGFNCNYCLFIYNLKKKLIYAIFTIIIIIICLINQRSRLFLFTLFLYVFRIFLRITWYDPAICTVSSAVNTPWTFISILRKVNVYIINGINRKLNSEQINSGNNYFHCLKYRRIAGIRERKRVCERECERERREREGGR